MNERDNVTKRYKRAPKKNCTFVKLTTSYKELFHVIWLGQFVSLFGEFYFYNLAHPDTLHCSIKYIFSAPVTNFLFLVLLFKLNQPLTLPDTTPWS